MLLLVGNPKIPNDMIREVKLLKGKTFVDDNVFEDKFRLVGFNDLQRVK